MVIMHNMLAMNADRMYGINSKSKAKSTEKLSSGYKINRAADDAAGLAISEKMRRQIRGLTQASANCQDGISFCQVADGALNEVHDMMQRINELAVQAANGTNSSEDREYLDKEVQQLKSELSRVFKTTSFNEKKIWLEPYVPEVIRNGDSLDFTLYNDTDNGHIGGVMVGNVRYSWEELGILTDIDTDGDHFKEDGEKSVTVYVPDAEKLPMVYKKGDTLNQVTRKYTWAADNDGIIINGNEGKKVPWSQMGLDPSNVEEKAYSFEYGGTTITFEAREGDTLADVIAAINGDGFSDVSWQTVSVGGVWSSALDSNGCHKTVSFTNANKDYLLDPNWRMEADVNGVKLKTENYDHTTMRWENFRDTVTGENPIVDWGLTGQITDDVTLDDLAIYEYRDGDTGFSFEFQLEDEASRESAIKSIDNTKVYREYEGRTLSFPSETSIETGDLTFTVNNKRELSFGMQNVLGRDLTQSDTFATDISITENAGKFTIEYNIQGDDQKASYVAELDQNDIRKLLDEGGICQPPLLLQNGDALLAGATQSEIDDGIKQMPYDSMDPLQIDFKDLSTKYKNALKSAEEDRKNGVPNAKTADEVFQEYYAKAADALKSLNTSTGDIVVDTAGVKFNYSTAPSSSYEVKFDIKVNPPWKKLDIQAGSESGQIISIRWQALNLSVLSMGALEVETQEDANAAIYTIQNAMQEVSSQRSNFGAYQNRMEHTVKNLDNVVENTTSAESEIRDTDMAAEMVRLSNLSVIMQAGEAMIAQANQSKQGVINLLQ